MNSAIRKVVASGVGAGALLAGLVGNALALDWSGITLATTDVDSVMALIIVGLATLWGYRKVIKVMNRS